jgi:hypothetical protein
MTPSCGGYFVSDEAENAATQKVIARFKSAKEAKARLEGEMSDLSEKLLVFAKALARPGDYRFLLGRTDLTVGQPIQEGAAPRRPVVRLESSDLDWQRIGETISSYEKARDDKRESAAQLRNMGLDIAE